MSDPLTRAQKMMVEDGLPAELILTPEQRRAAWKGRAPTNPKAFVPARTEEPSVAAFRAEQAEAAKAAQKAARKAARAKRKEDRIIRERQRARPAANQERLVKLGHPPTPEEIASIAGTTQKETKMPKTSIAVKKTPAKKAAPTSARAPRARPAKAADKPESKSDIVERMLKSAKGATREELSKATGWPHVNLTTAARRAGLELVENDGRFRLVAK